MTRAAKSLTRQRLAAERRRADVVRLVADGLEQVEIARELGVSRKTIQRDKEFIMRQSQEANRSKFEHWRDEHIQELYDLRQEIDSLRGSPEKPLGLKAIDTMLGLLNLDIRLKGTAAPERSIHANVSAEYSIEYLKFKKATSGLSANQLEEVYNFASALERIYVPPVMDGSWFPAPMQKELPPVDEFDPTEVMNEFGS
jgi:hypothetical protein